jgi:2-polyprenyl-6-methoxyphenol hydroxylase-like FAD-dependent oxidoreductase
MSVERGRSFVEIGAVRPPAEQYDVAILGGGLAGLTLAIQIKRDRPETSVVVLEKREGRAPLAAFKVGESTVASGAHYFSEVVGVREHLQTAQLRSAACGTSFRRTATRTSPSEPSSASRSSRPTTTTSSTEGYSRTSWRRAPGAWVSMSSRAPGCWR